VKPIEKGIIVELPDVVDSFIPASQLSVAPVRNFSELFKPGDKVNAKVIEFDKGNKKIVLSVVEYFKDKDQEAIDAYISRFKLTRKFTLKEVQERSKTYESEQIDFRIEDIIGDEVQVNEPAAPQTVAPKSEEKPEQK